MTNIWSQAQPSRVDWKIQLPPVRRPVTLRVLAAEGELPEMLEVVLTLGIMLSAGAAVGGTGERAADGRATGESFFGEFGAAAAGATPIAAETRTAVNQRIMASSRGWRRARSSWPPRFTVIFTCRPGFRERARRCSRRCCPPARRRT